MDKAIAYRLVEELRRECRLARLAFQELRLAANGMDTERVFLFAHATAQHAATLARYFWPERPASQARGEFLRAELKIADTAALHSPALRAVAEHPDERFEDWLTALPNLNFLEANIMPQTALAGSKPDAFLRSYDPDVLQFSFHGDTCDLSRVGEELRTLETACQVWLRGHTLW